MIQRNAVRVNEVVVVLADFNEVVMKRTSICMKDFYSNENFWYKFKQMYKWYLNGYKLVRNKSKLKKNRMFLEEKKKEKEKRWISHLVKGVVEKNKNEKEANYWL